MLQSRVVSLECGVSKGLVSHQCSRLSVIHKRANPVLHATLLRAAIEVAAPRLYLEPISFRTGLRQRSFEDPLHWPQFAGQAVFVLEANLPFVVVDLLEVRRVNPPTGAPFFFGA